MSSGSDDARPSDDERPWWEKAGYGFEGRYEWLQSLFIKEFFTLRDFLGRHERGEYRVLEGSRIFNLSFGCTQATRHGKPMRWSDRYLATDFSVSIKELLEKHPCFRLFNARVEDIVEVVNHVDRDTKKQRYEWTDRSSQERANLRFRSVQGHSAQVVRGRDLNAVQKVIRPGDPEWRRYTYHGTTYRCVHGIKNEGLIAGGLWGDRAQIHSVAEAMGKNDIPGLRHGSQVIVGIDNNKCYEAGIETRITRNNVFMHTGDDRGRIPRHMLTDYWDLRSGAKITPDASGQGTAEERRGTCMGGATISRSQTGALVNRLQDVAVMPPRPSSEVAWARQPSECVRNMIGQLEEAHRRSSSSRPPQLDREQ